MQLQKVLLFSALVFSQGALYPVFADRVNDAFGEEQRQKNAELIRAVKGKDIKAVRELLNAGADPDARATRRRLRTALMVAIYVESSEIVDLLLKARAQVNNVKDIYSVSVIEVAIDKGNPEILAQVLEAGAGKDTNDWEVMLGAIFSKPLSPKVIQMLISNRGIGYYTADMDIILSAAIQRKSPEVVEMLLKAGINLNERSEQLFNDAMMAGNIKIMELILDKIVFKHEIKGQLKNFKFHMRHLFSNSIVNGRSVLVRAVAWGNLEAVKLLLDRGIDPAKITVKGESLRDYAQRKDLTEIVKLLDSKSSALSSSCNTAFGESK